MGEREGLPDRLPANVAAHFPRLSEYRVTSPKDPTYNCIAFAAGDTTRKWACTPFPIPGYYWPSGAIQGDKPDALQSAFEQVGFELADNGELEVEYDKIALYADENGNWSHAAIQTESGKWASKLGNEEDIEHTDPHCFVGSLYGNLVCFMRRRKTPQS